MAQSAGYWFAGLTPRTGKPENFNGSFAYVDGDFAITDRLGSIPVYRSNSGLSLSFWDLAASQKRPKLNVQAVADLCLLGYVLGDETLLEGVTELPPASTYRAGQAETYWRYGYTPNAKGLEERFHTAVFGMRRRAEQLPAALGIERLGLNLTEGRDSRLLATMFPAHCFTMRETGEEHVAGLIAKSLGYQHTIYDPALDRRVAEEICPTTLHTVATMTHCHGANRSPVDGLVSGHLGDVFSDGHITPALLLSKKPIHKAAIRQLRRWPSSLPFAKPELRDALKNTVDRLTATYAAYGDDVHAATAADLANRQRRFILRDYVAQRALGPAFMPFMDNGWIDFWQTIPTRWRVNHALYRSMLRGGIWEFPVNGEPARTIRVPELYAVRTTIAARLKRTPARASQPRLFGLSLEPLADLFDLTEVPPHMLETLETVAVFMERLAAGSAKRAQVA